MKKIFIATTLILLPLLSGLAKAAVIDVPHNEASNIYCSSCHSYSLWWQYSPISALTDTNGINIYKDKINALCLGCHDGTTPQYTKMLAHSHENNQNTKHGEWQTDCTDCHDPHKQNQLDWRTDNPNDLYLVTGTIAENGVTTDIQNNQTTIIYNQPTINSPRWSTPNSTDATLLTWERKDVSNLSNKKGLTFVHDTTKSLNTFTILSVDGPNNTIILKGILDPAAINTQTAPTSGSFGLIFGQLIKSHITSRSSGSARNIKFFDPNILYSSGKVGGYVDLNTARQGMCQTCHQYTDYWTEDGSTDTHNSSHTKPCNDCHATSSGFMTSIAAIDHGATGSGKVLDSPDCVGACHLVNNPILLHKSACDACHEDIEISTALANYETRRYVTAIPAGGGNCMACHGAYTDFPSHPHDHTSSVLVNQNQATTTENCRGCHNATTAPFIAVSQVHSTIPASESSRCANCHNMNNAALIGSASNFTTPTGECKECHVNYFNNHKHGSSAEITHCLNYDPARDLSVGNGCGNISCHAGQVESWTAIKNRHSTSGCGTCHNSTRANGPTSTTVNLIDNSIANAIARAGRKQLHHPYLH